MCLRYLMVAMLSIAAAQPRFDFQAIEFAPAGERLPAARAFVATGAAPGTPIAQAVATIESAKAHCRRPAPDGTIRCEYSRTLSRSTGDMPIGDVTWTVRLAPGPAGTVASATVDRQEFGG